MTRKFLTVFVAILFLLPALSFAQTRALLFPDGDLKIIDQKPDGDLKKMNLMRVRGVEKNNTLLKKRAVQSYLSAAATPDTLSMRDLPGGGWAGFGLSGQQWWVQWFVAPADLNITGIGVGPNSIEADPGSWNTEYKIVKMAWTEEELLAVTTAGGVYLGYYEATGNGKFDASALMDNPDVTGGWVNTDGNAPTSPFGEDLWSEDGFGWPVTIDAVDDYTWAVMMDLGYEPSVLQGEIFGVVFYASGHELNNTSLGALWGTPALGQGAFKFYANGRLEPTPGIPPVGDAGWWARDWSWDMVAAVSLTGDRAPKIDFITELFTTLSTGARTVLATIVDDNPSGEAAGVAVATLSYSLDGGTNWTDVAMSGTEPNYSADIPGQSAGTEILYNVYTEDVMGLSTQTSDIFYSIFSKTEDVLFLYNVDDQSESSARNWYMGLHGAAAQAVAHDYWSTPSFGAAEIADVLELYDNVIQVDGSLPSYVLDAEVLAWIQTGTSGTPKRYFLSSQDYGCALSGDCSDITFDAGSFQVDFLGVAGIVHQDFSTDSPHLPPLVPLADDPVSGWVATYNADSSVTYHYDSNNEMGFTNYIDAIDPVDGGNVVANFTTLDSIGGTVEWTVGVRNNGDGFYTAFQSFDYQGTNFRANFDSSTFDDPDYAWGVQVANQAAEFLNWGGFNSIDSDLGTSPHAFRLDQNYPNPFNPTTTIEYNIPNKAKVTLKIFDIQGREVVRLVDNNEAAGKHTVNFDASEFATGIYFYQLSTSDNQSLVKKMMFIK
jgi:hypothetical protein